MEESTELKAHIFDIQGLSIHDGPGCRTVVFLKGCPLNCSWCSNPEGIKPYPEILYHQNTCISDGNCLSACSYAAISIDPEGNLSINRNECTHCQDFACIEACLTGALTQSSRLIALSEIGSILQRDRQYWGSTGGLTLSGGEPLLQSDVVFEILRDAHQRYIHTAIETCGHLSWDRYARVLPFLDWIFFDLKHTNPKLHKTHTRQQNQLIFQNAIRLANEFSGRLVFRTPIIKGFNDDDLTIRNLASFICSTGRKEINLLPLHLYGREKYKLLGLAEPNLTQDNIPSSDEMKRIAELFNESGITTYIGSDTDF